MPNESDGARPGELSTREAAGVFPLAEQPLDLLCATGKIPGAVFRAGKWFLPRTSIEMITRDFPRGVLTSPFAIGVDYRP